MEMRGAVMDGQHDGDPGSGHAGQYAGPARRSWVASLTANGILLLLACVLALRAGVPDDMASLLGRLDAAEEAFVPGAHYIDVRARWSLAGTARADIVAVGDSHVSIVDWDELLGRPVAERGIGGDSTRGVRHRLEDIAALRPRVVVVMAGHNDLAMHRSPQAVAADLRSIATTLLDEGASRVILTSVLPTAADHPLAGRLNPGAEEVNVLLRRITDGRRVHLLDLTPALAPDGALHPAFSSDGVHLSAEGYRRWRDALLPLLAAVPVVGSAEPAPGQQAAGPSKSAASVSGAGRLPPSSP
jgi:lysophospholipase L1-like esterase